MSTSFKPGVTARYFQPREFGDWSEHVSAKLLACLDAFRELWGAPVVISPVPGAVGRRDDSQSQHNVNRWGEVRAVDCFPRAMATIRDMREAVDIARTVGITGIGVYPDWRPQPGLHLDVRASRDEGDPALWAGVGDPQQYVAIGEVIGYE